MSATTGPFGGAAPPAALFHYSRDRGGEHPAAPSRGWTGILQADAYAGFGALYAAGSSAAPVTEAAVLGPWPAQVLRARRHRRERAARANAQPISPLALEAVKRIDAIFDIERTINGLTAAERLAVRQSGVAPLVADLERWMRAESATLSATPTSPRRWTTCSAAGQPSPASSTMAGSA